MNLKPAVADVASVCLTLDATGNCDNGYYGRAEGLFFE